MQSLAQSGPKIRSRSKCLCEGVTSIASDASRQGHTREDTAVYLVWDVRAKEGTVAAPQVHMWLVCVLYPSCLGNRYTQLDQKDSGTLIDTLNSGS